jgi:SAM-dependent methyltransferase
MALRPSNRKRNRLVVALLGVQPQDHVLEIGFGPGLAIRELARRATDGFVLGIDPSEVMVSQAAVLLAAGAPDGVVEELFRSIEDISDEDLAALWLSPSWPGRVVAAHTVTREILGETRAFLAPSRPRKSGFPS